MPECPPFVDFVIEQFSPLGEITVRFMMGGWIVYCDGFICALIANNEVYLKGDAKNIPAFEARGLKAFRPFDDQDVVMNYFQAPPEIFEDSDAMRRWVGGALEASKRAKKKPKAKGAKKSVKKSKRATR